MILLIKNTYIYIILKKKWKNGKNHIFEYFWLFNYLLLFFVIFIHFRLFQLILLLFVNVKVSSFNNIFYYFLLLKQADLYGRAVWRQTNLPRSMLEHQGRKKALSFHKEQPVRKTVFLTMFLLYIYIYLYIDISLLHDSKIFLHCFSLFFNIYFYFLIMLIRKK